MYRIVRCSGVVYTALTNEVGSPYERVTSSDGGGGGAVLSVSMTKFMDSGNKY